MLVPLVPEGGGSFDVSSMKAAASEIQGSLRGNVFYQKMDVQVAPVFFDRYPVSDEPYEGVSNVAISDRGIERIRELDIKRNGKTLNMTDWGVRQYLSGEFDFDLSPNSKNLDTYAKLRQVLRWIRYSSEDPDMVLSETSKKAIRALLNEVLENRGEVIQLLGSTGDLPAKIQSSLEKLQLYSGDSVRTRALLHEFGIDQLAQAAGVLESRILEPLPHLTEAQRRSAIQKLGRNSAPLGTPLKLNHRTSLAAAQNISKGAIWQSNNESIITGKRTRAAYGAGLYAATGTEALSYGDMYVAITLSPEAVEGIDFTRNGSIYVIKNRGMIQQIEEVTWEKLYQDQLRKAIDPKLAQTMDDDEIASMYRTIGSLIQPTNSPQQYEDFKKVWKATRLKGKTRKSTDAYFDYGLDLEQEFLESYFQRPGEIATLLSDRSELSEELLRSLVSRRTKLESASEVNLRVIEAVWGDPVAARRSLELSKWAEQASLALGADDIAMLLNQPALRYRLEADDPSRLRSLLWRMITSETPRVRGQQRQRQSAHMGYAWDLSNSMDLEVLSDAIHGNLPSDLNMEAQGRGQARRAQGVAAVDEAVQSQAARVLVTVEARDPIALAKHFPNYFAWINEMEIDEETGKVAVFASDYQLSRVAGPIQKLSRGEELSAADQLLMDLYFTHSKPSFLKGLLGLSPKTKNYALGRLSGADPSVVRMAALLVDSVEDEDIGPPRRRARFSQGRRGLRGFDQSENARPIILKEIRQNPQVQAAIRELLLKGELTSSDLVRVVLSPKVPEDQKVLRVMLQNVGRPGPSRELVQRFERQIASSPQHLRGNRGNTLVASNWEEELATHPEEYLDYLDDENADRALKEIAKKRDLYETLTSMVTQRAGCVLKDLGQSLGKPGGK